MLAGHEQFIAISRLRNSPPIVVTPLTRFISTGYIEYSQMSVE